MTVRASTARLWLIAAAILFVAGCSRISLLYGYAETALADEAEFHFELDEAGRALIDRKVDELLTWHSAMMLPRYAQFMNAQADLVESGRIDRGHAAAAVATLRLLFDDLVRGAAPHAAEFLADQAEAGKLRYFEARMKERLTERRQELSEPPDERLQARIERIIENFERLTGDLNDLQIGMIHRYAAVTAGNNKGWLRTRANRQRAFLAFLARRPGEAQISAFVYRIVMRGHEIVDPNYEAVSEGRWNRFQALLADIMTSLTPEQRATASATLREYAAEMLELSG